MPLRNQLQKQIPLSALRKNFGSINPYSKPEDFAKIRKNFERKVGEDASKEYLHSKVNMENILWIT